MTPAEIIYQYLLSEYMLGAERGGTEPFPGCHVGYVSAVLRDLAAHGYEIVQREP